MVPEKFYSLLILFLSLEMISDINELFEPFTAEINIEKMDINFVCSQKCNGLCSFCGINKNNLSCNHNEKNSKESPFSSLSQLDL